MGQIITEDGPVPPLSLIAALYHGRQITTPDRVIELIRVIPVSESAAGYDANIHNVTFARRFTDLLHQYLKGSGHPKKSEDVIGIPPLSMESEKNNPSLRSSCFVETITGTPYLPQGGKLTVNIILIPLLYMY